MNNMLLRCMANSRFWSMLLCVTLVWGASQVRAEEEQQKSRITQGDDCSVCEPTPGVLHLYAKNKHTWEIRPAGAKARLEFSRTENNFTLHAHALEPNTSYVLIQYESSYPRAAGYIVVGGISDADGDLILEGQWQRWKGKFWLVPRTDVSGEPADGEMDHLLRWNPERYLFEGRVL
ncbi:MAG: hypothetical protein ACOC0G_01280 [Thermodesulfobacteriota bacterium]